MPAAPGTAGSRRSASGSRGRPSTACGSNTAIAGRGCYREKQAIRLDVLASEVDLLQGDANRWTAWYNLQLARLDILRATELLLDYIEKAGIAAVPAVVDAPPKPGHGHGLLHRMVHLGEPDSRR